MLKLSLVLIPFLLPSILLAYGFSVPVPNIERQPKVVYGKNDRTRVLEANSHRNLQLAYDATMAVIHRTRLKKQEDTNYLISSDTWKSRFNMCPDEQFIDEPIAANCTSVLITPTLALTAAHCITGRPKDFCKHNRFVLGYKSESKDMISEDNIFRCTDVVEYHYNKSESIDWAIVGLDREVTQVDPIEIVNDTNLARTDELTLLGYPAGLPLKVTPHGTIREMDQKTILANFDSFSGNSGSPVFQTETGKFVGILIGGEDDYQYDKKMACLRPKQCAENSCSGEAILNLASMKEIFKYIQ